MADPTFGQNFVEAIDLSGWLVRAANSVVDHWWLCLSLGVALWIARQIRTQHALLAKLDERADAALGDVDAPC